MMYCFCFFFKQKTADEMRISDWSSDVCSSDLVSGVFHSAHQFLADDQLLDLRSAFVNAEDTHIAEEALDRGLAHIAGAAMDLDRPVGDPAHHLGAEHLRARGLERHALARVVAPRDVAQHALGRIEDRKSTRLNSSH